MRGARGFLTAFVVVATLSLGACHDTPEEPAIGTPGTSFYGTYTDQAGHAGTVELAGVSQMTSSVVLAQGGGISLIGELRIGGSPIVQLTGRYDAAALREALGR